MSYSMFPSEIQHHNFYFIHLFIVICHALDPVLIPGTLGAMWEYTHWAPSTQFHLLIQHSNCYCNAHQQSFFGKWTEIYSNIITCWTAIQLCANQRANQTCPLAHTTALFCNWTVRHKLASLMRTYYKGTKQWEKWEHKYWTSWNLCCITHYYGGIFLYNCSLWKVCGGSCIYPALLGAFPQNQGRAKLSQLIIQKQY